MKHLRQILLALGLTAAMTCEAVSFKINCPASPEVKAGSKLVLTETFINDDCYNNVALEIDKVISGFAYNNGGAMGLLGPTVITLKTPKSVPLATCDKVIIPPPCVGPYCYYYVLKKRGILKLPVTITNSVPKTAAHTLALASVGYMQDNDPVLNACQVTVKP